MGSSPSSQESTVINAMIAPNLKVHPEQKTDQSNQIQGNLISPVQSQYNVPQLQQVIRKAHKDLHSKDPIGKKRYFFQVVNFIFQWLQQAMRKGKTLFQAQAMITQDLQRACKDYPIGTVQAIQTSIKDIKPAQMPNLLSNIQNLTKEKFTDRIKQRAIKSKEVSYEFNKNMQIVLQKDGGFKFKGGYKSTGIKAYMRILTKILEDFMPQKEGSKLVYTDMNHYYWTPIFIYFNKLIDKNINNLKVDVYDWMRCKVFYKTIGQLESAYQRLNKAFGKDIFRVKNRINGNTRDVLINLKYKDEYAQVQLALVYDSSAYNFSHKLYELTRQKLGVAYCCFTILLDELGDDQVKNQGVMTQSGYIKRAHLRQKVQDDFERLTKEDAQRQWKAVEKLLDQWDIVALNTGIVKGSGYPQRLSDELYGPELSQMFIIKRKTNDYLTNWLNWMV